MQVKGIIDSLNFSSTHLEAYLTSENYIIETVKSISVFTPKRWIEEFKKPLSRNIIEAKILHTSTGLTLPIKRFSISQDKQTLELAGLHGYNYKSKLLSGLLNDLMEHIQDEVITRLDVAIDFKGKIPNRVIKALCKNRKLFNWINSTYVKTQKEKKTNYHINICIYPKHLQSDNNLNEEMHRLEFSFKGAYFRGQYKLKDISKAYEKMRKSIKRLSGLDVEILSL